MKITFNLKAYAFDEVRTWFRCYYVLVQFKQSERFRDSEHWVHTCVTVSAFALSFFPQGLFSVRAEKKS